MGQNNFSPAVVESISILKYFGFDVGGAGVQLEELLRCCLPVRQLFAVAEVKEDHQEALGMCGHTGSDGVAGRAAESAQVVS